MLLLTTVLAALGAFYAFTFQVSPDELGVVLRFGKVARQEPPGLHFRMPYPIEQVRLARVTRRNTIEIGLRAASTEGPSRTTYVREESQMLTADENIVDVSFVIYWHIQDAQRYLFNIRDPEGTVKAVAESAMREIVGKSNIEPILTRAREETEQVTHKLVQEVLDRYGAGIRIDHIQLQRIDPPTEAIDAFRDVQAAAADKETLKNQALAYSSRIIPEARGDAERILQSAKGYRQQTIAEATGQAARFLKVQEEYGKAPGVTRTRLYLETMERVFASSSKIIIDGNARVVPYLSLQRARRTE
jgi:membrane protease subunit HflK